jgi:signal transduction histidine kinase
MWKTRSNLVVRLPLLLLAIVFLAESAIMTIFAVISGNQPNRWLEVVIDSTALATIVAPLMYWLIVRPLRTLADERAHLLAHVFQVQDEERQRLARDLHDEIGQSFTSLQVQLRVLEDAATLEDAHQQARHLRELGGTVYDQIRRLARGLHPTVLDDLGLAAAIERLAEDFEAAHGVAVALHISGFDEQRLDRRVESTVYRIVQESLTNCAKHAQATRIELTLSRTEDSLVALVVDNGRGFDVSKVMHSPDVTRFGLANMRQRALLVRGTLSIRSAPDAGTIVSLRIPLTE